MRLIDADALMERMTKAMESGSNLNGTFHLHIEHAPTIEKCDIPHSSKPQTDLISRADAIKVVRECFKDVFANKSEWDATKGRLILQDRGIAEYNNAISDRLSALPSAEAVHKPDYSYEADMVRRLAEAKEGVIYYEGKAYKGGTE